MFFCDFSVGLGLSGSDSCAAMGVGIEAPKPEHANRAPGEEAAPEDSNEDDCHQGPPEHLDELENQSSI